MPNEITQTQTNKMSLMKAQQMYITSISNGLESLIGKMDNYQALCGYNILSAINVELMKNGLNHTSKGVDKESINNAIKFAVIYRLNTDNREVFVIVRNEKRKNEDGSEYYTKKIECKPQGKGSLKIVEKFGTNVSKIYPEWIVREGDDFEFPTMEGIKPIPPKWTRKSTTGKVLRVVVPILYKDGYIDYRIADREGVAVNIKAQIKQNVMFNKDKDRILALIQDMTLDQLLSEPSIKEYVNETYTGISSEEMIITKLILNAVKRVSIDYSSAVIREITESTFDNADVYKKSQTASEIIANEQTIIELETPVKEITQKPQVNEDGERVVNKPSAYAQSFGDDLQSLFQDDDEVK